MKCFLASPQFCTEVDFAILLNFLILHMRKVFYLLCIPMDKNISILKHNNNIGATYLTLLLYIYDIKF